LSDSSDLNSLDLNSSNLDLSDLEKLSDRLGISQPGSGLNGAINAIKSVWDESLSGNY
jgi:hypothetical protein